MRNDLKIIKEAYETLKTNEWRWKSDNDYRREYRTKAGLTACFYFFYRKNGYNIIYGIHVRNA